MGEKGLEKRKGENEKGRNISRNFKMKKITSVQDTKSICRNLLYFYKPVVN